MKERMDAKMAPYNRHIPVIYIVGASGAGKTTLIEKLIPELTKRGYRVGTIKHDVHGFQLDRQGKDSWRHKEAGASVTVISSSSQIGMVKDVDHDSSVEELMSLFADVDLILTEGYKRVKRPKLEVFRPEIQEEPLCKGDQYLVALVTDEQLEMDIPRFGTDRVEELADFVLKRFNLLPDTGDRSREAVS